VVGPRPEKYTPFTLRVGREACPRWLNFQLRGPAERSEPFNRWNIRYALLAHLGEAHRKGVSPTAADIGRPPDGALLPEETWFYDRFAHTYAEVFSSEPGTTVPHGCDYPNELRGVSLGGAVDLLLDLGNDAMQLRQLELWGRDVAEDPLDSWELRLALARLHSAGVVRGSFELCHVDLNRATITRRELDIEGLAVGLVEEIGAAARDLRSRSSSPQAVTGSSCAMCAYIPACSAWEDSPPVQTSSAAQYPRYTGRVVQLTPSSAEAWLECPRKWRARYALGLPGWPLGERGRIGIQVHAALAWLHAAGPCANADTRRHAAATINGELDEHLLGHLDRHSRRCPSGAVGVAHALTLAELISSGPQAVMLTARVDAIWEHDGILDCRDYKTGPPRFDRVADDIGAQAQAAVLSPLAAMRGVQLRLRYEHLCEGDVEDPEYWEPDEDDVEEARDRFSAIAEEIATSDFAGVADPTECRRCPYWKACPDSATDVLDEELIITIIDPDENDA
jgi:CRISPR/Cas system-associated exonuclease Cas4 (RecB family)